MPLTSGWLSSGGVTHTPIRTHLHAWYMHDIMYACPITGCAGGFSATSAAIPVSPCHSTDTARPPVSVRCVCVCLPPTPPVSRLQPIKNLTNTRPPRLKASRVQANCPYAAGRCGLSSVRPTEDQTSIHLAHTYTIYTGVCAHGPRGVVGAHW